VGVPVTNWSKYPDAMRRAVQQATDVKFHIMTEAEHIQSEKGAEQMWAADEAARCKCEKPKPDEYTLSIDCGSIGITHTPCGKSPWFMFDDWNEVVCMANVPIRVEQITGCSGGQCYGGSCDCGPEVYLAMRKEEK